MRPVYDDFDDFDGFDFADSAVVRRMLREQSREEVRLASRRHHSPTSRRQSEDHDGYDDYNYDSYEDDYETYDDYDDDEFDEGYGVNIDH